jgi:hypothetical protein
MGIFGVQGRVNSKILQKQQELLKSLPKQISKNECYGLTDNSQFMDLLLKILNKDALERISP